MVQAARPALPRLPQDPYLEWAELTAGAYLRAGPDGPWRIALTAEAARALGDAARRTLKLALPPSTASRAPVQGWLSRGSDLHLLGRHLPSLLLVEPGMRAMGSPARNGVLPEPRAAGRADDFEGPVLGVIDGRCGFLNNRFMCGPLTRLGWVWDQDSRAGLGTAGWQLPAEMGYGRELDAPGIQAVLDSQGLATVALSPAQRQARERQAYAALDFALPADADWSHGTHVLDTVLQDFGAWRAKAVALAGEPRVVAVLLPDDALLDTSGRWTAAYVLDALDYIVARAGRSRHIVVNISLGAFAGPHDGSSLVERGIDERIAALNGRLTVVVAAGNAGRITDDGTGKPCYCARRVTVRPQDVVELPFELGISDTTETLIELWSQAPVGLRLRLSHSATELDTGWVDAAQTAVLARQGQPVAAVIHAGGQPTARGAGHQMLVALGHTRPAADLLSAPLGAWVLRVCNTRSTPIEVQAWMERRDMPGELMGYRPQHGFVADEAERAAAHERHQRLLAGDEPLQTRPHAGNLCSLAHGRRTVVVSALDLRNAPADYASTGPSRNGRGVDVWAPGERASAGFLSHTQKQLRGTSMAAAYTTAALLADFTLATFGKGAACGGKGCIGQLPQLAALRERARLRRGGEEPLGDEGIHLPAPNTPADQCPLCRATATLSA